jgi:hypothetical protein
VPVTAAGWVLLAACGHAMRGTPSSRDTPRGVSITVWDERDYVWMELVRSFGNIMSELLHTVASVVLPRSAGSGSCLTDSGYCWH